MYLIRQIFLPEQEVSGFVGLPRFDQGKISRDGLLHDIVAAVEDLKSLHKNVNDWIVIVAYLVERSLPTPEIRGSIPFIGNVIYYRLYRNKLCKRDKNKEKEAGNGPIKIDYLVILQCQN